MQTIFFFQRLLFSCTLSPSFGRFWQNEEPFGAKMSVAATYGTHQLATILLYCVLLFLPHHRHFIYTGARQGQNKKCEKRRVQREDSSSLTLHVRLYCALYC